jgi:hypothetical protein
VQADGGGFPDLVIVGNGEAHIAELKREDGRPSPAQKRWLAAWGAVDRAPAAHLWKPSDLDEIVATLCPPGRRLSIAPGI